MTRANEATRTKWAKAILGSKYDAKLVETCIASMLAHENRAARRIWPATKSEREAVKSVATALHRLNSALRKSELPPGFRALLPTTELEKHFVTVERLAFKTRKKSPPPSNAAPKRRKHVSHGSLKSWAATYASWTLQELGMKRVTTRSGILSKLASAYYGDREADLFDYVRHAYDVDHLDAAEE